MTERVDPITLAKAILWEETKGKLRALAAVGGCIPSTSHRSPDWGSVSDHIDKFIADFESRGFHE